MSWNSSVIFTVTNFLKYFITHLVKILQQQQHMFMSNMGASRPIQDIKDLFLTNRKIITMRNAKKYLGNSSRKIVPTNPLPVKIRNCSNLYDLGGIRKPFR